MAHDAELGRTSYLFTAPNERATAIELVAHDYPDEEISAEITPITDVTDALAKTMVRMRTVWSTLPEPDQSRVTQRYMALVEAGDSSLVKLNVPGGGQNFDWHGFYVGVEAYL